MNRIDRKSNNNGNKLTKNKSNGLNRTITNQLMRIERVLARTNNAVSGYKIKRNMLPKTYEKVKKIESVWQIYSKSDDGEISLKLNPDGSYYGLPMTGANAFNPSLEYKQLNYVSTEFRIVALGAEVNFVNVSNVTPIGMTMKWNYGTVFTVEEADYDSTWQPIDFDNKGPQKYRTDIPKELSDVNQYGNYSNLNTDLNKFRFYFTYQQTHVIPSTDTLIGCLKLIAWIGFKPHQLLRIGEQMRQIVQEKDEEISELKNKVEKLTTILNKP